MQKINRFIITTQPGAADTAIGELQKINGSVRTGSVFSPEVRMITAADDENMRGEHFRLKSSRIIFTRHIFPVHYFGELSSPDWESVLPQSGNGYDNFPFSVQLRVIQRDETLFSQAKAVLESAEALLISRGFKKDDKHPEWVLSLLINNHTIYAGVSWCADNLSHWNGGEARYKKDGAFISRAEFKLLEAFEAFGIGNIPLSAINTHPIAENSLAESVYARSLCIGTQYSNSALDLGAAPGGWSKALLDSGYTVTAVDPAEMHPSLSLRPGFKHVPQVIQRCGFADGSFDIIVNDMRMDIYESARIMLDSARLLRPGALALMTLKLTPGHWLQKTGNVFKLLEEKYKIINARQLFHNREEITVYCVPI